MTQEIAIIGTKGYFPHPFLSHSLRFKLYKDLSRINSSTKSILFLGSCPINDLKYIQKRPRDCRLIFSFKDAATTVMTLQLMQAANLLKTYLEALVNDDRFSIVRHFYKLYRPDIILVNNNKMLDQFRLALKGLPVSVYISHPPGNKILRLNAYDCFSNAPILPILTQIGGGSKYIDPLIHKYIEPFVDKNIIKLVSPNIQGGSFYEDTIVPTEPQIVISCRAKRSLEIANFGKISVSNLEFDWKPATKYFNSIYSGSSYIGYPEASVQHFSEGDELVSLIANVSDLPTALRNAIDLDFSKRRSLSRARLLSVKNTFLSPSSYASSIASLCD